MFGLFEREKREPVTPELLTVSPDPQFDAEYERVAVKVGTVIRKTGEASSVDLRSVLTEEAIHVYPLGKVEAYMDKKGYWAWHPLRETDARFREFRNRETPTAHAIIFSGIGASTNCYDLPVPLPALLTAERIMDRLGPRVSFWVAALNKDPDPFLGVMLNDDPLHKMYVVERWDEPGFRS